MATNVPMPALNFSAERAGSTPTSKINYYSELLRSGFSDPEIRAAATSAIGPQPNSDWNFLQSQAGAPPQFASDTIKALRRGSTLGSMNPGVTSWEFDYDGTAIGPRTRTPGGANNPDVLTLPVSEGPPPVVPPPVVTPPVVTPPVVTPPDVVVPVVPEIPTVPDVVVTPPPPLPPPEEPEPPDDPPPPPDRDIVDIFPGDDDGDDTSSTTGTVIVELLDEDTGEFVDLNEIELGGGEGESDDDDVIELGGGEGDKVGTVTIEDFTPENPAVIPNNDSPVIRDILDEQVGGSVGTVTIEPVDNVDVTTIDQGDNDPFGWDRWDDPNIGEGDIIDAADNDPFGWDQWEGPDSGDDAVPVPANPTDEELEELMLLMAAL